jgi:hypothetical protein
MAVKEFVDLSGALPSQPYPFPPIKKQMGGKGTRRMCAKPNSKVARIVIREILHTNRNPRLIFKTRLLTFFDHSGWNRRVSDLDLGFTIVGSKIIWHPLFYVNPRSKRMTSHLNGINHEHTNKYNSYSRYQTAN